MLLRNCTKKEQTYIFTKDRKKKKILMKSGTKRSTKIIFWFSILHLVFSLYSVVSSCSFIWFSNLQKHLLFLFTISSWLDLLKLVLPFIFWFQRFFLTIFHLFYLVFHSIKSRDSSKCLNKGKLWSHKKKRSNILCVA